MSLMYEEQETADYRKGLSSGQPRASRAEEIEKYGKQILMRTITHKSKKVYDRKRLKKAGINYNDDLPLFISAA